MAGTELEKIVDLLNKGQVVAFSTDTVNGMGALCNSNSAIEKIFSLKKRSSEKPFALFFHSKVRALEYFERSPLLERVIDEFMPGPLTIVARVKKRINPLLAKDNFASFRIPKDRKILLLLESLDKPLAVTSLNLSGKNVITSKEEALKVFKDVKIFGKLSEKSIPSSVIRICNCEIEFLREGAISKSGFFKRIKNISNKEIIC
ncbi:MAG: L-threonylcarbamoyladenylate synthase [bacterium]|nr:L-threonylcarbamoyladenylate synthase [bacterium]